MNHFADLTASTFSEPLSSFIIQTAMCLFTQDSSHPSLRFVPLLPKWRNHLQKAQCTKSSPSPCRIVDNACSSFSLFFQLCLWHLLRTPEKCCCCWQSDALLILTCIYSISLGAVIFKMSKCFDVHKMHHHDPVLSKKIL